MTLPPDYVLRPVQLSDAEAVIALMHACSQATIGENEEHIEELLLDWEDAEVDRDRDTRVILNSDGKLIAYGIVGGHDQYPHLDIYVHPDLWGSDPGCEPLLFAWAVERARDNAARIPADHRLALRAYTHSVDVRYKAALEAAGLRVIRHSFQMAIHFTDAPSLPAIPDGYRLRVATGEEDWRPIYDVRRDAWRDHFGNVEGEYEKDYGSWKHYWERFFSPGCWLVLENAETIAAICLCEPRKDDDENYGWISTLAVRRAYRQRGLGTLLLQRAFATLHAMGKKSVALGVDASSITNAVRLYERAGMHVKVRYDLYELELRAGIETSVTGE
jgi:mycothiol synthase